MAALHIVAHVRLRRHWRTIKPPHVRMGRFTRAPRAAMVVCPEEGLAILPAACYRTPARLATLARALWNGTGRPWVPGRFVRIGARI